MSMEKKSFGSANGIAVDQYIMANASGAMVKIITFGATITEIHVPDKSGKIGNAILGFDNLAAYQKGPGYLGATVGRVANRIANATFQLDGKTYKLPANNGPNTLHGGVPGWDKAVWKVDAGSNSNHLILTHVSPDGDNGFPGEVSAKVEFTLKDPAELQVHYYATTTAPTPINLTNHTYFNLAGPGSGDILDHVLTMKASHYTPVDEKLIPTGEIRSVRGTPMDFLAPHPIGARIDQVPGGYDHNFVFDHGVDLSSPAVHVHDPKTGRALDLYSDHPAVQFYSGNFLNGSLQGIGGAYTKHAGFCLEPQHFPDSVHHPNFPSTILRPGEIYKRTTRYRFSAS